MFALAFDKKYIKMGVALINSLNYYHSYPMIVIYTTDIEDIQKIIEFDNVIIKSYTITNYSFSDWHPLIWAKIEAFSLKVNEPVVFMDVDMIMYKNIDCFIEKFIKSGFIIGACKDDDAFIDQFIWLPPDLADGHEFSPLNAGIIIFYPNMDIYKGLIEIANDYHNVCRFPEQGILNIFCYLNNGWFCLGEKLSIFPYDKKLSERKKDYCLLHFYAPRPDFFGCSGYRKGELTYNEQIIAFEEQTNSIYPLKKIEADFLIRYNNLILFEKDLIAIVSCHFDVSHSAIEVSEIVQGWTDTIRWKVQLNDIYIFIKEKLPDFSLPHFKFKLELLSRIYAIDNTILPKTYFAPLGVKIANKVLEIQEWIESIRFVPLELDDYFKLGALLGKLSLVFEQSLVDTFKDKNYYLPYSHPETKKDIIVYFKKHTRKIRALESISVIENIVEIIENIDADKFKKLPTNLVHGDIYGSNIRLRSNRDLFVIDFDDIHIGCSITDLSLAIGAYCSFNFNNENKTYTIKEFDFLSMEKIIQGYLINKTISNTEQSLLKITIALNALRLFIDCLYLDDPIPVPKDIHKQLYVLLFNIKKLLNDECKV